MQDPHIKYTAVALTAGLSDGDTLMLRQFMREEFNAAAERVEARMTQGGRGRVRISYCTQEEVGSGV